MYIYIAYYFFFTYVILLINHEEPALNVFISLFVVNSQLDIDIVVLAFVSGLKGQFI